MRARCEPAWAVLRDPRRGPSAPAVTCKRRGRGLGCEKLAWSQKKAELSQSGAKAGEWGSGEAEREPHPALSRLQSSGSGISSERNRQPWLEARELRAQTASEHRRALRLRGRRPATEPSGPPPEQPLAAVPAA